MSVICRDQVAIILLPRFLFTLLGLACLTAACPATAEEPALGLLEHPAVHHAVIEPAGPHMPRADTASVAELGDGRLIVVYHKYEPGKDSAATTAVAASGRRILATAAEPGPIHVSWSTWRRVT